MSQHQVSYHKTEVASLMEYFINAYDLEKESSLFERSGGSRLFVVRIDEGSANFSIRDRKYVASTGDVFLANAEETVLIDVIISDYLKYTVVTFSPSFISQNGQWGFDAFYLRPFYQGDRLVTHKISGAFGEKSKSINEQIKKLEEEMQKSTSATVWKVKGALMLALAEIVEFYIDNRMLNPDSDKSADQTNQVIENIIGYIDDNLSQTLTLNMFAEMAHMNPFYFSTYFKKHTSMSPSKYVLYSRVNRAKELLIETDKTILDIAMLCGFNSTANFNKAFKKIVGQTPSEFRNHPNE